MNKMGNIYDEKGKMYCSLYWNDTKALQIFSLFTEREREREGERERER